MRYWKRLQVAMVLGLLCFSLICGIVKPISAAFPVEETILPSSRIHHLVLQETIGFLVVQGDIYHDDACFSESFQAYRELNGTFAPLSMVSVDTFVPIVQYIVDEYSVSTYFPLTRNEGNYREIVVDPSANTRLWIDLVAVTTLLADCENTRGASRSASIYETYFAEEDTMLDADTLQQVSVYQSLENDSKPSALQDILDPFTPPWHIFINQFQHFEPGFTRSGVAELWIDHNNQFSPLGWLRLFDEQERPLDVWELQYPRMLDVTPFFLSETIVVYDTPSERARQRTLSKDESGEIFSICQMKDGFVLLCRGGLSIECDMPIESIGWIKLRDTQHRLTIWPRFRIHC